MSMRAALVTGVGLVTPLGPTTASTWAALTAGTTAIRSMHHHDALPVHLAATVSQDQLPPTPPLLSPCPAFAAYALCAAREALIDAGLLLHNDTYNYDNDRAGVSIGVGMAHLPEIATTSEHLSRGNYRKVSPYLVPRILPNTPAGLVSSRHNLRGPTLAPATACAAGAHAVADGLHAIQRGDADVMIVGGTEAAIHPIAVAGFARARALATRTDSAPFDSARSGFVLGEGAAILVLESLDHLLARSGSGNGGDGSTAKAQAYAQLVSAASTGDAHHITSPCPNGSGAKRAMWAAIKAAGKRPHDVDYVNAHATGTPIGDAVERAAIATVLSNGDGGDDIGNDRAVVSSTKGATGHLLGAAGAVEAAFTALAIAHDMAPPTVGLKTLDEVEELTRSGWGDLQRYVPGHAVETPISFALSNSFGFGGTNACLTFAEPPDGIDGRQVRID